MNQILTDAEITLIIRECARGSAINRDGSTSHRIARAIEQAILNKLSEQEPVAWLQTSVEDGVDTVIARTHKPDKFNAEWWKFDPLYLHPAPSVPEWQPIETAPKDGTVVLLAGCRKPVAAAWLEDEIDYWHVDDNKLGPFALRGPAPTHWMPLPKPPAARSE